jgi:hypothetical protein
MKRLRNAWGAPRRAREPVCFHHETLNAHREQLYGSPKAATQPSRLHSADGAFWGVLTHPNYRFALVVGTCAAGTADDCHRVTIDPDDRIVRLLSHFVWGFNLRETQWHLGFLHLETFLRCF